MAAEALTYPAKAIFLLLWPIRRLSQDKDIVVRRYQRGGDMPLILNLRVPEGLLLNSEQ